MDVICPVCKHIHHETTDKYDPSVPCRGDMIRLKEPWKSYGWAMFGDGPSAIPPSIGERASINYSMMECPWCCNMRAPKGKLKLVEESQEDRLICHKCGKTYAKSDKGEVWYKKHIEACNAE